MSIDHFCLHCNKIFFPAPHQIKRGDGKYCSRSCVTAAINKKRALTAEQIFNKNIKKLENGCWEYQVLRGKRYGVIKIHGISISAHRYSYKFYKGEIPEGMLVCHTCDYPPCVNPEHLFLGNSQDNMSDKMNKKRHRVARGSLQGHAKLNEQQVKEIKILLRQGVFQREIAKKYNTNQARISKINVGQIWKHVIVD